MPSRVLTPAQQAKKQRVQLAVAGVLAVVLAAVVLYPPSTPGASGAAAAQPGLQADPLSKQTPDAAAAPQAPLAALPKLDLDKVVAANPFVSPQRAALAAQGLDMLSAASAQVSRESTRVRDARAVKEVEVQAIVHDGAQPSVLIDGEIAGLHDTIRQRWRIIEVLPQSVRVEYVGD